MIDKINQKWPDWQTEELLGRGAFGEVYKAKKETFGQVSYSAVKIIEIPKDDRDIQLQREMGKSISEIKFYFKSIVDDLIKEIKSMESLKAAPNIISIEDYDILENEDGIGWTIFIRMELLNKLSDYYDGYHQLDIKDVLKLGIDICSALEYCEKVHIVHRDIKPSNLFISDFGDYKLGDFGIARELEKTSAGLSQKGTMEYMAPEVIKNEAYGNNIDTYSLGLVLYYALNNRRLPFLPKYPNKISYIDSTEAIEKRLRGDTLPIPDKGSEQIYRVIQKACEADPKKRYQSAKAFKSDLQYLLNNDESVNESLELPELIHLPPLEPLSYIQTQDIREDFEQTDSSDIISEADSEADDEESTEHGKKWMNLLFAFLVFISLSFCCFFAFRWIQKSFNKPAEDSKIPETEIVSSSDPYFSEVSASSSRGDNTVDLLTDGSYKTYWVNGNSSKNDSITFSSDQKQRISYIKIFNGVGTRETDYLAYGRVKKFTIEIDDKIYTVPLKDEYGEYILDFTAHPLETKTVVFSIEEIYDGNTYSAVAISEITFE